MRNTKIKKNANTSKTPVIMVLSTTYQVHLKNTKNTMSVPSQITEKNNKFLQKPLKLILLAVFLFY
jgi:hypothetical protein